MSEPVRLGDILPDVMAQIERRMEARQSRDRQADRRRVEQMNRRRRVRGSDSKELCSVNTRR